PASSTARAAVWMVPGSFGLATSDLAAITTFAPSRAARRAMARPMPREAPVMRRVLLARLLMVTKLVVGSWWLVVGGEVALHQPALRVSAPAPHCPPTSAPAG